MKGNWRLFAYGLVGASLLAAALAAPAAWATPDQSNLIQTVPTRTPTPTRFVPVDTVVPPTFAPPTSVAPGRATPTPTPFELPPAGGITPVAPLSGGDAAPRANCPGNTSLALVADRQAVWPGATVVFTATLANTGRQALAAAVLETQLPAGLDPGAVLSGAGVWQGRTLRATAPTLPPGAKLVTAYSARVTAAQPGQAITVRAVGSTAGCQRGTASVTLALPPSQLPPTGGGSK